MDRNLIIDVAITGSREWPPEKAFHIWNALERVYRSIGSANVLFHHGVCPYGGADLIGASWAAGAGWEVKDHPPIMKAGWAYAKRNQEMIDLNPDYIVACFLKGAGNRGTSMTYDMAIEAGLEDRIIKVEA